MIYPESKYLTFQSLNLARWTGVWCVNSKKSGATLGVIQWFGRWRQYAFFPAKDTIYNSQCLWEITQVIESANKEQEIRRRK